MSESPSIFVAFKQRRLQQGFKLFEVGVATAIFGILVTVLLQRLWFYQEQAEEVAFKQVVANVRAALNIKLAQGHIPGNAVDLTMLSQQNPLDWLSEKPASYLGEFNGPPPFAVTGSHWYFDRNDNSLIYLLNMRDSFGTQQLKQLKFKVKLLRLPKNPAKPDGTTEAVGVAFVQLDG